MILWFLHSSLVIPISVTNENLSQCSVVRLHRFTVPHDSFGETVLRMTTVSFLPQIFVSKEMCLLSLPSYKSTILYFPSLLLIFHLPSTQSFIFFPLHILLSSSLYTNFYLPLPTIPLHKLLPPVNFPQQPSRLPRTPSWYIDRPRHLSCPLPPLTYSVFHAHPFFLFEFRFPRT